MAPSPPDRDPSETSPLLKPSVSPASGSRTVSVCTRDEDVGEGMSGLSDGNGNINSRGVGKGKGENDSNQSVTGLRACCIIASLGVLIFLQASNMSMMTTTQSNIAADLDAFASTSWFTSAYLIASSSVAPLAGRLSNIFPPRLCILVSSTIFAIGSFLASRATSLPFFLFGRVITGIGAAGVNILSIILVIELTNKKRRGLMIGLVNSGFTSGVSLGAVIAGALVGHTGWRFILWIQTPIALLAGICVFLSIPRTFTAGRQSPSDAPISITQKLARVDYLGAITLTSSLVSLLYSLAHPSIPILPLILSLLLIITFLINELYISRDPLIPVTLLLNRGALLSCLGQLGIMMSRWTVLFYAPIYAISLRNWAPAAAGSMLIPTNAGFATGSLLAGFLHIRRGGSFYTPTITVFAIFPLTLLLLSFLSNPSTHVAAYIATMFANGLVTGAALNYTLAHLLHLTAPSTHFIATSLLTTFRGFAGSFGSAIGGGVFTRILSSSLQKGFTEKGLQGKEIQELTRKLLGSPAMVGMLAGDEREVAVVAYTAALKGLFLTGTVLSVGVWAVQAGTGWKGAVEEGEEEGEGEGEEEEEGVVDASEDIGAA